MNKKNCKITKKEFVLSDKDLDYYKNIAVPNPSLCPEERLRRRLAFRNERNLYKRTSDLSGASLLSMYHPDLPYPVYTKDEWLSDKWNPFDYGKDIDWDKSLFEQFYELQKTVPRTNLMIVNDENSEYCNYVGSIKNCYLCFGSIVIEDCMYGNPYYSKNCIDCFLIRNSELCYECIDCDKLYGCIYLQDCYGCSDCFLSYDLRSCRNCFGCVGLRNKEYYVFNTQYSKEEYEKFIKDFSFCDKDKFKMAKQKLAEIKLQHPHRASVHINCDNVTGNYIFNSKNCSNSFQIFENEDCSFNIQTTTSKDCYDMNYTEENELCYEYIGNYRNNLVGFSLFCYGCNDVWYSDYLHNCKNCFACCGLKNAQYCILNKQYTKDEYEDLKNRLIKLMVKHQEWGEFFPIKYSPFAYNETIANDYFPLNKEDALSRGYRWREKDKSEFKESRHKIPDDIENVDESICDEVLSCELSGRNYRITKSELKFYKRMKLPVPKKHFFERHKERWNKRLPYKTYDRKCDKCSTDIQTSYSPQRPETVYCEKCYLETVL